MGIRLADIVLHHAKHIVRRHKSCFAVYVGEEEEKTKRIVIPVSYLNRPSFQDLLSKAAEEFGFDHHRVGGLRIPCSERHFIDLLHR
ncbi:auxin-induced protein 15A-like [Prunus yedoensis var. nudiflora]|uniref:Auxin-induced protein 15A-like n=1 Tax=Prunus yedoensis var. nudiflora TaxID=2094558 RepID=A0A314Y2W4_PRUYE|nr:auxin-induced protein 15A-like [Prunus yedoensis var. nudiflora]